MAAHAAKRRRLSPAREPVAASVLNNFYANASQWDLEQDYERRPRKGSKKEKERTKLPIKTAEGAIQHVQEPDYSEAESLSLLDSEEEAEDANPAPKAMVQEPVSQVPIKLQIIQAKENLAKIAMLINEDPEEHLELFKKLAEMVKSAPLPVIKKLALATQAAVYRDVIPGYKIRPIRDEELAVKVSKDVRKLRDYEQALLSGYRNYIHQLTTFSRSADDEGLKSAAINCACNLLAAVPHFNFRQELLKILVYQLSRRQVNANFVKARETLKKVFVDDEDGIISMEAVGLLTKMMKVKNFHVHYSVLDTFLHLRLLSEFSMKGSKDGIDKDEDESITYNGKKIKEKREFRTKKERKMIKAQKGAAKDLKEADALIKHEQRDKMQAETLKLVFTTYFRILKLRNDSLIGSTLEGLAKYAHLINRDFFGDLLEVLRELISESQLGASVDDNSIQNNEDDLDDAQRKTSRDSTRESLLCSTTAFALLEGQDANKAASTLHLDLSFFISHLYQSLYPTSLNPEIEFNPNTSLRLPEPGSVVSSTETQETETKVNFQTPTVLLLRCLQSILTAKGTSAPTPLRVAGFTKRLMTGSIQLPEKSSLAVLSLLNRVAKIHARKVAPLWNTDERKGDGVFNPYAPDVEGSNVFAGTMWEGELLRVHFCPQIRDAVRDIEKTIMNLK
ncbi:hypothetical protein LOZ53_001307 [Ophidiomyces ophidiicola]|nr:hypothetical protein LOZ55_002536 [Ophidiomyces ophidiicola]KAI1991910.1 hypothetical protein LOZ51_004500 [Ophidiomyces ophidiicola]KAI1993045.1 hypothetical protein LOZ54_001543 [Ophidiomyces ophidiicola]KAI1995887.1 hypothetical protein LOZ53_001307 [Ophidiomyces ophidiicola]